MQTIDRRYLLGITAFNLVALTGCTTRKDNSESDTPQPTTIQNTTIDGIQIIATQDSAVPHVSKRIHITNHRILKYRLTCSEDKEISTRYQIPQEEYQSLVTLVRQTNITALADEYECKGSCPGDVPGWRYQFKMNSTTKSIYVESNADDVPQSLQKILNQLNGIFAAITTPTCSD